MPQRTALVLNSGGLNSAVLSCIAKQEYNLAMLHIGFGHRAADRERSCFARQVEQLMPQYHLTAELPYLAGIHGHARIDRFLPIEDALALREGGCNSFIPGLIPTMLGVAQSFAASVDASVIMLGVSENLGPPGPATGELYPDYRRQFYHLYNHLLQYATRLDATLRIETPLITMSRQEIVSVGRRLGANFELTWSCLRRDETPCGTCYGCATRARGFLEAGIPDPLDLQVSPAAPAQP